MNLNSMKEDNINKSISPSISKHLFNVIFRYGLYYYFICIFIFIISMTWCNYESTLTITTLNSGNYSKVLIKLVIINFINKVILGSLKEQFENKIFLPKFCNSCTLYLSELMGSVDPTYLEKQEKIHTIIPDGSNALFKLGTNIIGLTEPFLTIFSSVLALSHKINSKSIFPILMILLTFFIIGLLTLRYDYICRQNMQKEMNKQSDIIRNLWESYFVYYLNGLGSNSINEISKTGLERDKIMYSHNSTMGTIYWILEWIQYLFSAITSYFIINNLNSDSNNEIFALFYVITNIFYVVWWLFCSVRNTLTSTASWGTIELFIESYKSINSKELKDFNSMDLIKIFPQFIDLSCTELRLFAESGGGKTTWMRRKVIQLMNTYKKGWLYLDQKMKLPKDNRTIQEVMCDYIYVPIDEKYLQTKLCEYSEELGIQFIINPDTLDTKFAEPSGGEEKRILTLRALLPILLGVSGIKIVFNDEITAGLDKQNWIKVRKIIEEIKTKYGIKFITIDHHDFDAPKLTVKKKSFNLPKIQNIQSNKDLVGYLTSLFKQGIIEDKKEPKDGILVWIDEIEEEPIIEIPTKDVELDETTKLLGINNVNEIQMV